MAQKRAASSLGIIVAIAAAGLSLSAYSQTSALAASVPQKGTAVTAHATGTFDVKVTPVTSEDKQISRMSIDKQIHGGLEATTKGQMLAFSPEVKGSGSYVALEQITGTLNGRKGSFVLQHSGTMNRGALQLIITVVPDSGTGELAGLTGTFDIKFSGDKHFYDFTYTLPEEH